MSTGVELNIRSKLDPKGFRDLDANLAKARTSAVGLGKATANALGAGMGPAGELLSQINAVAGSMDSITVKGVAMATGIGAAIAGMTLGIKEAKEAFDEMIDARADEERSRQGSRTTAGNIASRVMEMGIQPGTADEALKSFENAVEAARFTDQSEEERNRINKAREFIQSGQAETLGAQKTFERNLTPEARKGLEDQRLMETFGGKTPAELQTIVDRAERDREKGQRTGGASGAQMVNDAQAIIDEVSPFLEAVTKAFSEDIANAVKEEAERLKADTERANEALSTFFDGDFKAAEKAPAVDPISGIISDARQRIGGSANAPMLSTWRVMSDLQKQTAANTAAIARNTSRTTPASSPVSPASQPR